MQLIGRESTPSRLKYAAQWRYSKRMGLGEATFYQKLKFEGKLHICCCKRARSLQPFLALHIPQDFVSRDLSPVVYMYLAP